jgi:hypothetical protein
MSSQRSASIAAGRPRRCRSGRELRERGVRARRARAAARCARACVRDARRGATVAVGRAVAHLDDREHSASSATSRARPPLCGNSPSARDSRGARDGGRRPASASAAAARGAARCSRARRAGARRCRGQGATCPATICAQSSSRWTRPWESRRAGPSHPGTGLAPPRCMRGNWPRAGRRRSRTRTAVRACRRAWKHAVRGVARSDEAPCGSSTQGMSGKITPSRSRLPAPGRVVDVGGRIHRQARSRS